MRLTGSHRSADLGYCDDPAFSNILDSGGMFIFFWFVSSWCEGVGTWDRGMINDAQKATGETYHHPNT